MGDIVILFCAQHILFFGVIFWLLTYVSLYFNKKKNHSYKKKFYECGFAALSDIHIQININFIMIGIFLILYDIEFTFLFPLFFNLSIATLWTFILFSLFFYLIILSLVYDWEMSALDWQY